MSRGYGKSYRKGSAHASIQFDKLCKENSNKPSAARSAGIVGKWGITSFTSIRTANGFGGSQYDISSKRPKLEEKATKNKNIDPFSFEQGLSDKNSTNIQTVKPKKFFKSRNAQPLDEVQGDSKQCSDKVKYPYGTSGKKAKASYGSAKKFFQSKRSPSPSPNSSPSKRDDNKPPIVLRICRGKSRLLSDSDESESTPTPSSAPSSSTATSPRSAKDSQSSQPTRVTRSTRRSMQLDPGSSPATAETPTDSFASLLSPEYIPPEKFELERKAMYENLLGPSSPRNSQVSSASSSQELFSSQDFDEKPIIDSLHEHGEIPLEQNDDNDDDDDNDNDNDNDDDEEDNKDNKDMIEQQQCSSQATSGIFSEEIVSLPASQNSENISEKVAIAVPEPVDTSVVTDVTDDAKLQEADELLKSTNVDFSTVRSLAEPKKPDIPEDSLSESDSESSQLLTNQPDQDPIVFDAIIEKHKEEIMEKILEKPAADTVPVKLVISKKKGSIFKSRSMVPEGTKKRRALYKHKWCDDKDAQKGSGENTGEKKDSACESGPYDEYGFEAAPLTRVTRSIANAYEIDEPDSVTSVRCAKNDKDYYTVVRNVKKAHQIQEIGEFQEFNDDVEYILDALQDNQPTGTRCLSAITLATKCMAPAFRMHVRAHGIVAKFFKALHDATKDQSLGLCTATVMFVLSQDRLNMDLDRDCLELMLNLLESDVSYQKALDESGLSSGQLLKNKIKVKELCAEIQSQGHAMHLNLDNITVGQLAMETLLSLTSKRAGEWFKEELRELGGLQHIMETICECCRQVSDYVVVWTDKLLDKLRKVDRCMRVLENVTQNNEQNQTYLLHYNDGIILDTLVKLYRLCDSEIPLYPATDITDKESTGFVIREALLVTLKVLINLTHHFNKKSMGSSLIGKKPGIIDASLHLLLQIPHYIPEQKKFELGVLVLMLLINLIQDDDNKKLLVNAKAPANFESIFPCDKSALEVLIAQFYHCEELARIAEKRTDAILDGEKDSETKSQPKSHEEFIEETVAKLLQKAGIHMEYTFLASYIAMLIGFLIKDNPEYEQNVRRFLKEKSFKVMVEILKKFFSFMNLTASTEASICQIKDTEIVIKYMEACDNRQKEESTTKTNTTTTTAEQSQNLSLSLS